MTVPIVAKREKSTGSKDLPDIEVHKINEAIIENITTSNCNDNFFM